MLENFAISHFSKNLSIVLLFNNKVEYVIK